MASASDMLRAYSRQGWRRRETHWLGVVTLAFGLCLSQTAYSHDFWLHPETFAPAPGTDVPLHFRVGHLDDQDNWYAAPNRVVSLRAIDSNGAITDHQALLAQRPAYLPVIIRVQKSGQQVIALESHRAFSRLGAEKFNAYIKEEGILPIQRHRLAEGRLLAEGTEVYARCAKAIVQVGEGGAGVATHPLGMTLEITPLVDPADVRTGESLSFQVSYRGKPVEAATVHIVRLDTGEEGSPLTTDANGHLRLKNPGAATFMLHTAWAEPARFLLQDADYATTFSSLTFAVP